MRNIKFCVAFSALCVVAFSIIALNQMGFFNTSDDDCHDYEDQSDQAKEEPQQPQRQHSESDNTESESSIHESESAESTENAESTESKESHASNDESIISKQLDHFTSHVKKVTFEDALSSDNTIFMTIKLELVSRPFLDSMITYSGGRNQVANLTKKIIDQVREYFEGYHRITQEHMVKWKDVQIQQKKTVSNNDDDNGNEITMINVNDVSNLDKLFTRFYDELNASLRKAHADPNNYYPNMPIARLDELRFFPVWKGLRKCILVANTPYLKKDGFKTVERIVVELETILNT